MEHNDSFLGCEIFLRGCGTVPRRGRVGGEVKLRRLQINPGIGDKIIYLLLKKLRFSSLKFSAQLLCCKDLHALLEISLLLNWLNDCMSFLFPSYHDLFLNFFFSFLSLSSLNHHVPYNIELPLNTIYHFITLMIISKLYSLFAHISPKNIFWSITS